MENNFYDTIILDYKGPINFSGDVYEVNKSGKYVVDISSFQVKPDLCWLSPINDMYDGEPCNSLELTKFKKLIVISTEGYELPENIERYSLEHNNDFAGLKAFEHRLQEKEKNRRISSEKAFEKYKYKIVNTESLKKDIFNDVKFRYRLLDRLRMDCDYYLGYGNRYTPHLYFANEKEHIAYMKALWESFPNDEKPEWLTWEQIQEYEQKMLADKEPLVETLKNASWRNVKNVSSKDINDKEMEH